MTRARIVRDEKGVALVFVLIMLSVMTMLGLGMTGIGMMATTVTVNSSETASALAIADAGLSHARRLLMWQEWLSLDPFLQNGAGVACDGDELADPPGMPVPPGYPAAPADYIPAAGRAFGGGTYRVFVCDDHANEINPLTGLQDLNPNADFNRRLLVRSIGIGANGATATVEQLYASQDIPAVIINGNVLATGNPSFMGAAGAIHGNGTLSIAGNPCAQMYFSAVGTVPVSGGSAGGGVGCTGANLDTRPDSPPINIPALSPDTYKAQATYWLENTGLCFSGATGLPIACPTGWGYSVATQTWSGGSNIPPGTYWINGNALMGGSPGSAASPMPLTLLARGWIDIGGSPTTIPHLQVPGLAPTPIGISALAGTDVVLRGNSTGFSGTYYATHQVDVTGSSTVNGQVLAMNQADTPYPLVGGTNPVVLNAAGQMIFSGSPTINFNGNGIQALRALAWRECRTTADPNNPCGVLFGM